MRFLSMSVQTLGPDPESDTLLEISLVACDVHPTWVDRFETVEDLVDSFPRIRLRLKHERYSGSSLAALTMNANLLASMNAGEEDLVDPTLIPDMIKNWLALECGYEYREHDPTYVVVAGRNVSTFAIPFVTAQIPDFERSVLIHRNTIDPTMMYVDWNDDDYVSGISVCMLRANLDLSPGDTSLSEALDVAKLIAAKVAGRREICADPELANVVSLKGN